MTENHPITPPPERSLKERALRGLDVMISNGHLGGELADAIREVLEASPNETTA